VSFAREAAECPFCGGEKFRCSLFGHDVPPFEKSQVSRWLKLSCTKCHKDLFCVVESHGGEVSAEGVRVCPNCDSREAEDIPKTTYPVGMRCCPRCGSQLRLCWWRGDNFYF
jgi:hypothetical protein